MWLFLEPLVLCINKILLINIKLQVQLEPEMELEYRIKLSKTGSQDPWPEFECF